ncbi:MAG: glycosyltransferase, partial [Cytophagaceae bacterium]|nr:glycosyltransferase [Cytophagaceae bacterium]
FFDAEIQENKTHNPIHLVTVGHLNHQKAQDRIVKAIAKIKNSHSNIRLSIAGGGDCENPLKEIAEKLGVTDRVNFLGAIGRKEIVSLLKTADIFILSSRYENCPVALIEAQAMGVPCICTINNGSEDILLPGCGKAVIQDEEGEYLSKAISDTINTLGQYKRLGIREEAYKNFSPEKFAEKFYTVWESAIFQNKP